MKIAIIGAGIFGSVIAKSLAGIHEVWLFEKERAILSGSTVASVLRVHKGAHYPRDIATAKQSLSGFEDFSEEFHDAIVSDFKNYYAMASHGSKVSTEDFESFLKIVGIPNRKITNLGELDNIPISHEKVSGLFEIAEAVIDEGILKKDLNEKLAASGAKLCFSREIARAELRKSKWQLTDSYGLEHGPFDFVIRATYGLDKIKFGPGDYPNRSLEYHRTLVLDVELGYPAFGVTVVDGDFLTVLPKGKSSRHLIYAPSLSVLAKCFGSIPDFQTKLDRTEVSNATSELIQRLYEWLPGAPSLDDLDVKPILGLRAILPSMEITDRRTTEVIESKPGLIDVLSGKIDHCLQAARECQRIIAT